VDTISKKTQSLCNICFEEIPAIVVEENGQIYIKKRCLEHGEFNGLIEKDSDFYRWFIKIKPKNHSHFTSLLIPLTYRCNMDCEYCFSRFPERKDLTIEEIINVAEDFKGEDIELSGGEPTIRDDLKSIISHIKRLGKHIMLMTNGLKLSNLTYLQALKGAGLDNVMFSLDSLKTAFYDSMKKRVSDKESILDLKKNALANLGVERIPTILSSTIYPGQNDEEIKDLFIFALKNNRFINQLRLRSYARVGSDRSKDKNGYLLSELFTLFSEQMDIDKEILKTRFLTGRMGRSLIFNIRGHLSGEKFTSYHESDAHKNVQELNVKIVGWPTIENIDLQELKTPAAIYLPGRKKLFKIFHGMILDENPR